MVKPRTPLGACRSQAEMPPPHLSRTNASAQPVGNPLEALDLASLVCQQHLGLGQKHPPRRDQGVQFILRQGETPWSGRSASEPATATRAGKHRADAYLPQTNIAHKEWTVIL
jgi:hypothetical protein